QLFVGWAGSIVSSNPKITFTATPGMVLTANFIPDPYLLAAGTYNGLFYEENEIRQRSSGLFTMKVTTKGKYSGKLQIGSSRYSFSGTLNPELEATNNITRKGTSALKLTIRLGTGPDADKAFGVLSDTGWSASILADRAVYNSKSNPSPLAGSYTLVLPSDDEGTIEVGDGYGYGSVNTAGSVKFVGMLPDGTKVSQSVPVSKDGYWPMYIPLYKGNGMLVSWLAITNPPKPDITGVLNWIKQPDAAARYYRSGHTNVIEVVGATYVKPAATSFVVNVPMNTAAVSFEGGNLAQDFDSVVTLGAGNKVTEVITTNKLSFKFNTSAGTFSGKVKDPSNGKTLSFGGALLQKFNSGYGFALGTNQSCRVTFSP
ncbi:MAG TPA: hypothetical protein PKA41_17690, partial [Verrucomicrobiota bacterium]|nr:hypothetical protein [Verrucomicrobiota bacterium]